MAELQITAGREESKYYPYTGIFYANRHSFWTAGQDSYTLPPSQNPDMFQQLINVEPVTQGILQRRRGYTLFSNQNPTRVFTRSYAFRSEALSLRRLVWTSLGTVLATDESGSTILKPIFTPTATSRAPRMALSRDFGYFADGVLADSKKWDGTTISGNLTNWGIALNPGTSGPNPSGAGADQGGSGTINGSSALETSTLTSLSGSGGAIPWTISGSGNATCSIDIQFRPSRLLMASNFGFAIPNSATVTGVSVTLSHSAGASNAIADQFVSLTKDGGNSFGTNFASGTSWGTSLTTASYGSATSLWGLTLAPADVNSNNFGFVISCVGLKSANFTQAQVANDPGNFPDSSIRVTVYYTTPSAGSWTNPSNIAGACDGAVATAIVSTTATSNLRATNFGFSAIPGAFTGIQVVVTAATSDPTVPITLSAVLVKSGTPTGQQKNVVVNSTTLTAYTLGGQFDTWQTTLTPADFNGVATSGVQFNAITASSQATISIDCVQLTFFTQAGPVTVGAPTGSGSINLISGRTYFYTFENSRTGHNSTLSPASLSTGVVSNAASILLSGIPTPADPQVDTVLLLATADGNDQTTLFLAGSVPAGTPTFPDSMPDTTLLTQPVFQQTDAIGQLHGVANNNLPPLADFPTKHKGRLYMAQGHNLYFSKNLDDVTTSTGTITGKWEEAWPFVNIIDLSEFSETIKALLSDGETLWIGTERNIRRLIGDGPLNFQKPEIQFNECGVLNQECWRVVFYEGQPVGTMWMTPDFRVMSSDFNTYKDVGTPIQDVLNSINPSALQAVHACFVSKQAFDLYMLYVPTGANTVPDTVCVYNLRTGKWSIWQPTDQISTSLFNIDVNGNPQWLTAAQAGPLYFWDSTTLQDRTGNTPTSYPVTIQTSWLDLGDYTIRKFVNQIIPTTADQLALTVTVDAASNELDFNSPLSVVPATTVIPAAIPTDVFVPLASGPSHSRAFRFTFVSPSSTIQNVLTGFSLEAGSFHRY